MVFVFDMGGVLMVHDIPTCIERFKKLLGDNFPKLGLGPDGEGTFLMEQFETGRIGEDEFIRYVLSLARPGTTAQDVIDSWVSMHKEIPQDRIDDLRRIKNMGYRLFLLSNNNEIHWKDVQANYDLSGIFEMEFLSFREHISKPDPRLFQLVMDRTGIPASEIVFIDDLESNRRAAEALGWSAVSTVSEALELALAAR